LNTAYSIYHLGETAVTIAFDAIINAETNDKVVALYNHLVAIKLADVIDIIPSYHTVTLVFSINNNATDFKAMLVLIDAAIACCNWQIQQEPSIVEIPVCYDESFGLDILALAAAKKMSVAAVIKLHSDEMYRIYAIGFLPGFTYMGKVNTLIATPRKHTPRVTVNAGSVGIAGEQTGIYPLNSPGGWNIVGQTPLQLFDATREQAVLLKMGNYIKFLPITVAEYYTIKNTQQPKVIGANNNAIGIRVLKHGMADSVQDLGRYAHQHVGINPTGAMDIVAAQIANFLVGNTANEAVLELHFPASVFQFQTDVIIALSGADFTATINTNAVPINTPIIVAKNTVITFTKLVTGARCYLAVKGGFTIIPWLNSYSTNIKANSGGHCGRLLYKDDIIACNIKSDYSKQLNKKDCMTLPWQVNVQQVYKTNNSVHIILGNEYPFLCDTSKEMLIDSSFIITTKSDRMGYRLHGLPLQLKDQIQLISTAVTKGTIQLLPDGELIILMADHQTIGGYPRVAHVAQFDICKLAQMQAHQSIQFVIISCEEAIKKYILRQQYLLQIQNACIFKLIQYLTR
jgi:antagonist of KipI